MSTYNFNKPDCDPVELDRRITNLENNTTSVPSTTQTSTGSIPSASGNYSHLVDTYGGGLTNWAHVDFKTLFANFPKNSMGVVDGNLLISFDLAEGWEKDGVDQFFRGYHSFRAVALENDLRQAWEQFPGEPFYIPGTFDFYPPEHLWGGFFDTIAFFNWGPITADYSSEPIKVVHRSTEQTLRFQLNQYGAPLNTTGLTQSGGMAQLNTTASAEGVLREHLLDYSPTWGTTLYSSPTSMAISCKIYLSDFPSENGQIYNLEITVWQTTRIPVYVEDTQIILPQKNIWHNWAWQRGSVQNLYDYSYQFPAKEVPFTADPNTASGGTGEIYHIAGGMPFPAFVSDKIPDNWNSM